MTIETAVRPSTDAVSPEISKHLIREIRALAGLAARQRASERNPKLRATITSRFDKLIGEALDAFDGEVTGPDVRALLNDRAIADLDNDAMKRIKPSLIPLAIARHLIGYQGLEFDRVDAPHWRRLTSRYEVPMGFKSQG